MAKNKKCMIFETLNEVKTMTVKEEGDFMKLSGVFGVCGVRNNNHRIYETKNYKAMVDEMKRRIAEEGCPGELEHPSTMNITLENISHKINKIDIDENGVVTGEITLLNTPKGKIAQEIVRGGLPLFISSRAQGNVDKNGNVTLETLKTYDLVGSPGFSQAKLHLNESQICESIGDNCFIVQEKDDDDDVDVYEVNRQHMETALEKRLKEKNIEEKNNNEEMELQEALDRIEVLENEIEDLKKQSNQFDLKSLCEGIQGWIMSDYTKQISEGFEKWIVEEFSPEIEKWVVEDFAPEIEKWVVEDFAPEVEKWIVEEYSPEIEKWIVEEYTSEIADDIEKWIVEEYSAGVNDWFNNEKQSIKESIKESIEESKKTSLSDIDATLKLLEDTANVKPVYKRIVETEEPKFIAEMPEEARVKWNLADDGVKESIKRRAKVYNFAKNSIQDFWESVNWQMTPSQSINESESSDIYASRIRAGFLRNRRK